jgi:hypothetical protein
MTNINTLVRRVDRLGQAIPKQENVFTHPEWPIIRLTMMQTLEAYPEQRDRVQLAIAPLEKQAFCDPIVMRETIFHALEPFNDARLAVAQALFSLGQPPSQLRNVT